MKKLFDFEILLKKNNVYMKKNIYIYIYYWTSCTKLTLEIGLAVQSWL